MGASERVRPIAPLLGLALIAGLMAAPSPGLAVTVPDETEIAGGVCGGGLTVTVAVLRWIFALELTAVTMIWNCTGWVPSLSTMPTVTFGTNRME